MGSSYTTRQIDSVMLKQYWTEIAIVHLRDGTGKANVCFRHKGSPQVSYCQSHQAQIGPRTIRTLYVTTPQACHSEPFDKLRTDFAKNLSEGPFVSLRVTFRCNNLLRSDFGCYTLRCVTALAPVYCCSRCHGVISTVQLPVSK